MQRILRFALVASTLLWPIALTPPVKAGACVSPPSTNDAVVAAGTNQSTATTLAAEYNTVITVASGTGVILPSICPPYSTHISNRGANVLNVYPPFGVQIETFGTNNPATVGVSYNATITCGASQCLVRQ